MGWYDRIVTSSTTSRTSDSLGKFEGWSPSKSVSTFFGDSSTVHKTSEKSKFSTVLSELNRTVNLLVNGGFTVKYSDGSEASGKIDRKEMTISPDILLTAGGDLKSGSSYFDALDALNGRVILGSYIRNNLTDEDFASFSKSSDDVAKSVFQTVQQFVSMDKIQQDWKGFRPYIQAHKEATQKDRAAIEAPKELTEKELGNFLQTANWNMAYPDNPIEITNPEIKEVMDEFLDKVSDNFSDCVAAADYLRSKLKKSPPKKSDEKKDNSGGKSGTGGGESDKDQQDEGGKGSLKDKTPFDSEVFSSEQVKTDKPELASMRGEEGADECILEGLKVVVDQFVHKQSFSSLEEKQNKYKHFLHSNRQVIKEVEKCFLFQENQAALFSRGLSVGDIDEGNLHKIGFDPEFVYERKDIPKQMEHQVGILLDQSGSMGGKKMKEARDVVLTLSEGLRSYRSINQVIYGHTGQERSEDECILIPYKDRGIDNTIHLVDAPARLQNIDGLAIKYVADQMMKHSVDGKRVLLVISDGQPAGYGYGGHSAQAHTLKACMTAKRMGIAVFGIGICNAFDDRTGKAIYGAGNFVVINNTKDSLKIMTNRLKKLFASV